MCKPSGERCGGDSATNVRAPAFVGALVAGAPAACAQGSNSLDLFVRGTDNALWWERWNGTSWSNWASLGGVLTSSPAATSPSSGAIDVFVRGTDNALWERTTTDGGGSWSAWTSIGGQIASGTGPAACSWGSRLDVFVEGTNGALYQKTWSGSWSNWASLGGVLTSSPAATSPSSGAIDVFVRGTDNALWERTTTDGGGSWSAWTSIGGQIASGTGPAACSWGSRLDVFVEGTNGALYQKTWSGSWSNWASLGGVLTSSPAATSPSSGAIDVFVRGTDNALWEKAYNGVWSSWKSVNGVSQTATPAIFYVPQAGSTWVNQGTAGASYNAYVSTPSLFQTQSNGYPYWGDIVKNDSFVYIPAGSATNNQNVASWEIGFHFTGMTGQRFQKIWDKACGGFMIEIDTSLGANQCLLTIYRATTGGTPHARWYIPTDTLLRTGHNYYIQISWDTSAGPGHEPYPTVWIGEDGNAPVHQTHFDESGGARNGTGSWYNDSVGGANLGNTASDAGSNASAKTAWLDGGFFVYRQYNSIVDFSSGGSWNTDVLRWT